MEFVNENSVVSTDLPSPLLADVDDGETSEDRSPGSTTSSEDGTEIAVKDVIIEETEYKGLLDGITEHTGCCYPARTASYESLEAHPRLHYLAGSPYILKGYRYHNTTKDAIVSIFQLHNETCNIWTHLLGVLLMIALLCFVSVGNGVSVLARVVLQPHDAANNGTAPIQMDHYTLDNGVLSAWPLYIFFLGALACLSFSTVFHIFMSARHRHVYMTLLRFDYLGISTLVAGSSFAMPYYALHCWPRMYIPYVTVTALSFVVVAALSLWKRFAGNHYHAHRFTAYVVMGLVCSAPMFHVALTNVVYQEEMANVFKASATMLAQYLIGGGLYATRIPERFIIGWCDYWFSSHSIMHAFIVTAAATNVFAISALYVWRLENLSCAADTDAPIWSNS